MKANKNQYFDWFSFQHYLANDYTKHKDIIISLKTQLLAARKKAELEELAKKDPLKDDTKNK